jgi:hypothetical protein
MLPGPSPNRGSRANELTGLGEEQLRGWFANPVRREAPPRSELVIKLVLSMALPDVDPQSVIDIQRQATMRGLQALIRAKTDAEGDLAASLVAEAAIFNAEAEMRWLDYCEAGLLRSGKGWCRERVAGAQDGRTGASPRDRAGQRASRSRSVSAWTRRLRLVAVERAADISVPNPAGGVQRTNPLSGETDPSRCQCGCACRKIASMPPATPRIRHEKDSPISATPL